MNLVVIREYITQQNGPVPKVDFVTEIVRKNGRVLPKGCAGIRFINRSENEVYVDNVILEPKEVREYRSSVPICELMTDFRVNENIVGASDDLALYVPAGS